MSLYKRGKIWYVDIEVTGHPRIQRSTRTTNKRQAEKIEAELRVSLEQVKEQGKTLNDALILWLQTKERSRKDKSAIRILIRKYPSRPLSQVDGHDILDALSELSASYYNRIANTIKAAIKMAVRRGWCKDIEIPKRQAESTRLRFLTKEEWQRLEKELPEHVRALATFAISTGLRQANVLQLRWETVNLKEKIAWVDSPDTKSKKSLSIPLNAPALSVLKNQEGKHKEFVFTYRGKPIKSCNRAWWAALERAGIENFTWHDLRHTWASWHVQNGTPLAVLKELGGWSDINMVMRYAHLSPEHLRQYANNSNVT